MRIVHSVGAIPIWCWICIACSSGSSTGSKALPCPNDERVNYKPGLTLAGLCANNGRTVIVRFQTPQTVEQILPLLGPVDGQLTCDDPTALQGQPGKTCYLVRLGSDRCCGDAMAYFASLTSPKASADVPDPATPCSCDTNWTSL